MQIRFRENDMARHYEACRETDTESNNPCSHLGRYNQTAQQRIRLLVHNKVESNILDKYIEYRI